MRIYKYLIFTILIPAITSLSVFADNNRLKKQWGNIEYDGEPWVKNESRPYKIKKGLYNRHISLWASHGYYYNKSEDQWKWQRPLLYGTREDLFTQTIVLPYLIPMLENAGCTVFTPRERDWQTDEYIIDNDYSFSPQGFTAGDYKEEDNGVQYWTNTPDKGFAGHRGSYINGENPFTQGTARQAQTTKSKKNVSSVSYRPNFARSGRYAVYVSYQTQKHSVEDAHYTVYHKGQETKITVNQKMGGGTWVYIGTYDFDDGSNDYNRVVLTNYSKQKKGVVTTDAVRFGGGMGNIRRGYTSSGYPRALEGARYYAQWAGMPEKIYNGRKGEDDYSDDINTRPLMTNYMAGGSVFAPSIDGLGVPLELSLAVHSDAGAAKDHKSIIGSLSICTTNFNDERLNSGASRFMSKDFASALLDNLTSDMRIFNGFWNKRQLLDKNYAETRLPEIPSAIIEMLSHQNFPDMLVAQDPAGKFAIARSLYKTILEFVSEQHGDKYQVTPLTPGNFSVTIKNKKAHLEWTETEDPSEPSAKAKGYIVYTAPGSAGFDNGKYVKNKSYTDISIEPGVVYNFKVAAVNDGGESFPTEVLSVCYHPEASKTVMIVNGFHRLSSPAVVNNALNRGFVFEDDPGVTYGPTLGWGGDLTGKKIAGNDFDYVTTHANAISASGKYNIISCGSKVFSAGLLSMQGVSMVDLILGLEKNDGHSLIQYKTFAPAMREKIKAYLNKGGRLMVSGSYVGSDMAHPDEKEFLRDCLHLSCDSTMKGVANDTIRGMGTDFTIIRNLNGYHYAATSPDILDPVEPAICALQYGDFSSACVAFSDNRHRTFTMGFPFECISDEKKQQAIMSGILKYLLQ